MYYTLNGNDVCVNPEQDDIPSDSEQAGVFPDVGAQLIKQRVGGYPLDGGANLLNESHGTASIVRSDVVGNFIEIALYQV